MTAGHGVASAVGTSGATTTTPAVGAGCGKRVRAGRLRHRGQGDDGRRADRASTRRRADLDGLVPPGDPVRQGRGDLHLARQRGRHAGERTGQARLVLRGRDAAVPRGGEALQGGVLALVGAEADDLGPRAGRDELRRRGLEGAGAHGVAAVAEDHQGPVAGPAQRPEGRRDAVVEGGLVLGSQTGDRAEHGGPVGRGTHQHARGVVEGDQADQDVVGHRLDQRGGGRLRRGDPLVLHRAAGVDEQDQPPLHEVAGGCRGGGRGGAATHGHLHRRRVDRAVGRPRRGGQEELQGGAPDLRAVDGRAVGNRRPTCGGPEEQHRRREEGGQRDRGRRQLGGTAGRRIRPPGTGRGR